MEGVHGLREEEEGQMHSLFFLIKASDKCRRSEEQKTRPSGAPEEEEVSDFIHLLQHELFKAD